MNVPRWVYPAMLFGSAAWCLAVILAPVLIASGATQTFIGNSVYAFFHTVCHQLDERSLHLAGHPFAVCARCTGIYFGFFISTVLYPLYRTPLPDWRRVRFMLCIAGLPIVLDVAGGILAFHDVTIATRLITGGVFGSLLPPIVIPALRSAVKQWDSARRVVHHPPTMKGSVHV